MCPKPRASAASRARLAMSAAPVWRVEFVSETASTNADLATAAAAGEAAGRVRHTDHQTAGRGRLGRSWEAPPGSSLLVSVLFRPAELAPSRYHLLTVLAGVSARAALGDVAGFTPELKWPNDVMVGDRKLAGILAESTGAAVIVGMGMNLRRWEGLLDTAIAAEEAATRPFERDDLLQAWLAEMSGRYGDWDRLARDYRAALATLGRRVRVTLADSDWTGVATDVTPDGHLLVDGREIVAGDVVHLRSDT